MDEVGRPLYGDVFGTGATAATGAGSLSGPGGIAFVPSEIVRRHWGELREGSESEGEEEGEEMEMEDEEETQKRADAGMMLATRFIIDWRVLYSLLYVMCIYGTFLHTVQAPRHPPRAS